MKSLIISVLVLVLSIPPVWAQQKASSVKDKEEEEMPLSLADQRYQDGVMLFQKGSFEAGMEKINSALEADRKHSPSLLLLGEVSMQQGKEDEAKAYFKKVVKALAMKPNKDGEDFFHLGAASYYLEDYPETIMNLEKAISQQVGVSIEMMIPMLFTAAVKMEKIGRATMYAKKLVQIQPENQQALMTLISALFQQQNYREAEIYASQLLEVDYESIEAFTYLAMAQFYQQKFNDTIINAAKALNRGAESNELYYMLAVSFFEGEVYFQAIGLFKKYLEEVPDDARAHLYLGQCHQGIGEYKEAEEQYNMAIDLEPKDPYVYYQLGTLYEFGYKKMRPALPHYRTALNLAKQAKNKNLIAALEERIDVVKYEASWWPWK